MKRFFTRIFRFFWAWGFLKFMLFTITLIILLYVEEDWRGARAWAMTKAKWEARGVSFDPASYYPLPVPDDQNLAALPIFNPAPDLKTQDSLTPAALGRALHEDLNNRPPFAPNLTYDWMEGHQPEFDSDFIYLRKLLNLSDDLLHTTDDVHAPRTPSNLDKQLSEIAIKNLQKWYKADLEIYAWCLNKRQLMPSSPLPLVGDG